MKVLVIGGTAFIGPHVVRGLVQRGHTVTLLHRGETPLELPESAAGGGSGEIRRDSIREIRCPARALGDRGYYPELREEFLRAAPDVVIDMIPVTEATARAAVAAFRGLARRLVAISSQDVYRAYGLLIGIEDGPPEPLPLAEDAALRRRLHPYRGERPRAGEDPRRWMDDYDKILVERVCLGEAELPGTVLRLPMVYGPRDRQHRMFEYLKRMEDGRRTILLDADAAGWRWTRGYVENVAQAVLMAALDERARGRVYNVGEDAWTLAEWVQAIARAAGWSGEIARLPGASLPEPLRAQMRTEQDLVVDTARIRAELGYREIVPVAEGLARTVAWERAHPPPQIDARQFDYAAEDAVLEARRRGV